MTLSATKVIILALFSVANKINTLFFLFHHRFLNQAMKMFDATEVVPINFVFFTASAIVAGRSTPKLSMLISRYPSAISYSN